MVDLSDEQVKALLARAGLQPAPEDLARVRDLYDRFSKKLDALSAAGLDGEEPAGVFVPGPEPGKGARR